MTLLSRFRTLHRGEPSVVGEYLGRRSLHRPLPPPQAEARSLSPRDSDNGSPSQCYVQMAQEGLSPSPSLYHLLGPEDVKPVGEHPIAAGGFSDIWEGVYDGRTVVMKSYRCYVSFDAAQIAMVCCNWCLACRVRR